jgi:hypothetical protein
MVTNMKLKAWLGAALLATAGTAGYQQLASPPAVPVGLLDSRAAVVAISDDEKLEAEGAIRDILLVGASAGRLIHRPSVAHIGILYGQRRQAGAGHAVAVAQIVDIARVWADGGRETATPGLVHLGDDEILALVAEVERIGAGDHGGVFDLGVQLGTRRQAGQSTAVALRETGAWLVQWYGGENPWGSTQPTPTTAQRPMVGLLRIQDGISYADDSGLVLPTYAHAGDLFSVFVRDDGRALGQLDRIAAANYHGARVWLNLGCGPNTAAGCTHGAYWRGREVGPDVTPDYWTKLRAFRDAFRARGLRLVASQGDIGQLRDRRDFMQRLRALDNEAHVIDWLDCGNEAWQTGEPDPRRLSECVSYFGGGSALRTLTDAPIYASPIPAHEHLDMFSIPPADAFDIHSFRGGHSWDKRRHIWGYTYCGEGCPTLKTGIGSEGPGNGPRVSAIDNKAELDDEAMALLAVASHLGRQAYVWFSGEGVILDRGLETEAGFASVPRAVALLPRDVYTYQTSHHSGDRFAAVRVLQPTGEVRIDGRQADDGRFAYTIDGPPGRYPLRVTKSFTGRLCHPGTGACEDISRTAGESLAVEFTRGRVFSGQIQ